MTHQKKYPEVVHDPIGFSAFSYSRFATFLIVGATCFFLGILFSMFPYDYYVLWAQPPLTSTISQDQYLNLLEIHLKFLHASPALIPRVLNIVCGTGLLAFLIKLYRPSEINLLFDGASLVLYMSAVVVYVVNTVKGLRTLTTETYARSVSDINSQPNVSTTFSNQSDLLDREDTLRVMAASNTILAVILMGVLMLQAGQWYAARKEAADLLQLERAKVALSQSSPVANTSNKTNRRQ